MTSDGRQDRVEAWTVSQTAELLAVTSISTPAQQVRGTSVSLAIPLDETSTPQRDEDGPKTREVHTVHKRREPVRRDSLKRRESVLKGKEGSRQRRRWENDRLFGNPHAVPPLPNDWQVQATYPVRNVPYVLAPLWDVEYARVAQERMSKRSGRSSMKRPEELAAEKVAQELRAKLKRARGAKVLLQDLEIRVRKFVEDWDAKARRLDRDGLVEPDSEDDGDEEIVFVGRGGTMHDEERKSPQYEELKRDKMVYDSPYDDRTAAFSRYLVHSIAEYYGLKSWSRTKGDRREAYVGLKSDPRTRRPSVDLHHLPRPLWAVV